VEGFGRAQLAIGRIRRPTERRASGDEACGLRLAACGVRTDGGTRMISRSTLRSQSQRRPGCDKRVSNPLLSAFSAPPREPLPIPTLATFALFARDILSLTHWWLAFAVCEEGRAGMRHAALRGLAPPAASSHARRERKNPRSIALHSSASTPLSY
jgi:hypothetical protein